MFDLTLLKPDHFAGLVGRELRIAGTEHALAVESVDPIRSPSPREAPFSLVLRTAPGLTGAQGLYTLEHPELGALSIFLVPIEPKSGCARFEAVFN